MLDNVFNFVILLVMAVLVLMAGWFGRRTAGGLAALLELLGIATAGVAFFALVRPG
jgi:hypothetical protein